MNHAVDLSEIQETVDKLRILYPKLSFGSDFEPTMSGVRGIFDLEITRQLRGKDDRHVISMIISNNSIENSQMYLERIEAHMRQKMIIQS